MGLTFRENNRQQQGRRVERGHKLKLKLSELRGREIEIQNGHSSSTKPKRNGQILRACQLKVNYKCLHNLCPVAVPPTAGEGCLAEGGRISKQAQELWQ